MHSVLKSSAAIRNNRFCSLNGNIMVFGLKVEDIGKCQNQVK